MTETSDTSSTRPYLIRALHEWCTDNGLTPYLVVQVDGSVQVPREHVQNGEIVLNVSPDAVSALKLGNDFIEFRARFGGVAREILVPVTRVMAIYARENGQGMAFPRQDSESEGGAQHLEDAVASEAPDEARQSPVPMHLTSVEGERGPDDPLPPPRAPRQGGKPSLKRVK